MRNKLRTLAALLLLLPLGAMAGPKIQHWLTDNGARVYFVEAPELPMVDVRVVFDAGSVRDAGQGALAQMTNTMMSEGAGGLDADELLTRFSSKGARFGSGSLRDMAWLSVRSITDPAHLDPVIANLSLILTRPDFPEAPFERLRRQLLIGLQDQQQSPSAIASKTFFASLYGEHPYAASPDGTEESIAALKPSASKAFHQRYYVGRNAVIAIVGAVSREQARKLAQQVVGGLPAGKAAGAPPDPAVREQASETRISFPASQSHVLLGQPGMARADPDYYALYLGNHTLGGSGLVSLLADEIREKRGLSYSVYSYFSPMRARGPFTAGLQTRNDQVDEALKILRDTIREYVKNGPTDEQLQASKKNITGGFPLRIDSNKKIVGHLAVIGFYNLPLDYLDTFSARIMALTRDEVADALRRRINVETMLTVIVGGKAEPENEQASTTSSPAR